MPSLMIHLTVAKKVLKELNLEKKDEELFYLGTIMPDAKRYSGSQDDVEYRKKVQKEKNINHFRSDSNRILSYPDMKLFLKKYEVLTKNDVIVLAYFIHLYTDYYYFKYLLNKKVEFYDNEKNKIETRENVTYTLINKNKEILLTKLFFGKQNKGSLYKEYERINPYLKEKYDLSINFKPLIKRLNNLDIKVEEIKGVNIKEEIDKLSKIIETDKKIEPLEIFEIEEIYNFIDNILNLLKENYHDILKEFKLCYNNKRRDDINAK